jgi:hypothetical protein
MYSFPSNAALVVFDKTTSLTQRSNVTASLKADIPIPILFSMCWHSHTGGAQRQGSRISDYSAFSTGVCMPKKEMRDDWVPKQDSNPLSLIGSADNRVSNGVFEEHLRGPKGL